MIGDNREVKEPIVQEHAMRNTLTTRTILAVLGLLGGLCAATAAEQPPASPPAADAQRRMVESLDAPLLFVKRHSYTGIHIYDTFYKWPPGGGGIYVLENPSAPQAQWKIRPVIDPTTPGTLGLGVYTHPELSWDAKRLLFCFKGEPSGSTSIYEIGVDGRGLRRVTDPTPLCGCHKGGGGGLHDIAPAYLPDGRIVFLSTRPSGLVPCANSGVSILHVMNADGSDIHPISVNNVNEFDPSLLPDGRVLFGRWEYVDKNALTIQSLWTVNPDGTQETAMFANNMVFPEAVLDARPVPGSHLIVGTFAKHNSTPRGAIALIDPRRGKNGLGPIVNLEHPENPACDTGNSCEPWPVTPDVFLFSGRPAGQSRNVIELIDRAGHRLTLLGDADICLHAPMLIKPRPRPAVIPDSIDRAARTGNFFVQDLYKGLPGVKRGEIKFLRVLEETSRVSPTTMGGSPYNQTFLLSAALAFSVKNYLGVVPVDENGSAYFQVPAGRAVYLQALDADGRLVQSMRTFVQAAPGTTRSCIGCHEHKSSTPNNEGMRQVLGRAPQQLQPESWGSGFVDYPSMVQPVLDRHCVRCHGGTEGIAAGMDLSGGWTEHFSISYENLVNRRETQLIAHWIAGIDCMNGTALWSSQRFDPRGHGSGAAPLAKLLVSGHDGHVPNLTRKERDLLMAWIDGNGLFHGTWDYNANGCAIREWSNLKGGLVGQMQVAGCLRCHGQSSEVAYFENDWVNLKDPQLSRILRAPMAAGGPGHGLALCRERKVDPRRQRIHLLWKGYAHAVQPPEAFEKHPIVPPDLSGPPVASLTSTADPRYQAMLAVIRDVREKTLAAPRVDMPGAEVIAGACRQFNPPPLPEVVPPLEATLGDDGVVELAWQRSALTIGLEAELYRAEQESFAPDLKNRLIRTDLFGYTDRSPPMGRQHYALVLVAGEQRSKPTYAAVAVPPPPQPPAPAGLKVVPASGAIRLEWQAPRGGLAGYHVYRGRPGSADLQKVTAEPVRRTSYSDAAVEMQVPYCYTVRAVSIRGATSEPSPAVTASASVVREPMFAAELGPQLRGVLHGGELLPGKIHAGARSADGLLDLRQGGHASFPHHGLFDLAQPLSVECWVRMDQPGRMPVVASCGLWMQTGWFLQRIGGVWRWHVGGIDCDGGRPADGRWMHLVAVYDGRAARLFEDGLKVAEKSGAFNTGAWPGDLCIGQYSPQPSPDYQVLGRIIGVKLYHRAIDAAEAAAMAKNKPGKE
jgi:hypothetical protein